MNKVYEKVSQKVDDYFENKRNERSCAHSMIDYYQSWQSANKFFDKSIKFDLGKDESAIRPYLNKYIQKFQKNQTSLDDLDFLSNKLKKSRPNFFDLCEQKN